MGRFCQVILGKDLRLRKLTGVLPNVKRMNVLLQECLADGLFGADVLRVDREQLLVQAPKERNFVVSLHLSAGEQFG